ncbi:MAG: hypothetical protein LAT57_00130 [Balneolales bacterium]|nr:hypothetical protein [Balneolales bacterium]
MSQFSHIQEAEFEEINDWRDTVVRGVDSLTRDRRGFFVTEAIIAKDLSPNPQVLRNSYQANARVVDEYFKHIDAQKVVDLISGDGESGPKSLLKQVAPVALGIAIGGLVSGIILRRF